MDYEVQLKLQAYLDGELSEAEAREIGNLLAKDREAVALQNELRNTRQALSGFEVGTELPESREFFWSKVKGRIERLEAAKDPQPAPASLFAAWRKFLMPAGAIAALALALFFVNRQIFNSDNALAATRLEASRSDPGTFTYRDPDGGGTLVWLSYPAEDEPEHEKASGSVFQ
jgi:anti-sigma factor RsiW